jgi:uncharacterized protein YeaO (DUF488 family)
MANKAKVQVRRVYDPPAPDDGTRVLVDRIWPRGLTKIKAHLDEWCKQVAPSTELRKWYRHDPARFDEFTHRYHVELTQPERSDALTHLRELAKDRTLTLLTATKQPEISEAEVLAEMRTPGVTHTDPTTRTQTGPNTPNGTQRRPTQPMTSS